MKKISFLAILFTTTLFAQAPKKPSTNEIYEKIQKLNFLGKVLYVAAHPDDENTKLITYFSNHYHANTAYLSLTRGDGGQNLIGPELREKLGAIRTQELLAARRIDGGTQYFTRANDFGYSIEPNETFSIWNKKEVLADVVQAIENFQPDIIINRFDYRTPGTTHGHHTASAMLSLEAYDLVKVKPKRLFFNTSWWFYGSEEKFNKADKSKLLSINANVYYPILGKSNHEIAALSRSQHKCQGFGSIGTRGDDLEYLELIKGNLPSKDNLFEGIDTSWNRIKGGNEIAKILLPIQEYFNFKNPASHLPQLVKAYQLIQNLEDEHWKKNKTEEIKSIIEACAGLYLEAISSVELATPNSNIEISIEAINRSDATIKLNTVLFLNQNNQNVNIQLNNNEKYTKNFEFKIPENWPLSNLFWLNEPQQNGLYTVSNSALRNLPELNNPFPVVFELEIENQKFSITKNLSFKKNEPNDGETYNPFVVVPKFAVELTSNVYVFSANQTKEVQVKVTAFEENASGVVSLQLPNGWISDVKKIPTTVVGKNESFLVSFNVTSPDFDSEVNIKAIVESNDKVFDKSLIQIDYKHIPKQTILETSSAKFVNLDIKTTGKNIGYIMGAGDEVGKNLENLDYKVTYINPKEITLENLKKFDAVIVGIRAFNVLDELKFKNKILFEYTNQGGNVIVQYNTTNNLLTNNLAPYPITLSRERVTNEDAEVKFIHPNHPVLNTPNKITSKDFEGWVQERGLYFPNKWDNDFIPILAMHDNGEDETKGSLLIAKYGKGNYIYTGISFFRELPEGVSGAYKLLANLIALKQ
ncbi:GlcNAc-PI de-N-acetylase [Flavobacterium haoranii]|uniref:GlcNAc-PI de-N-acetylase n=2 Tax=Flavobacterium haoranii TaxID=683124 RepID=A0A1M6HZK0_9FLAO|nr:GlcNAc-PI de-N-acetylase [Flavobacterium haoranii]